MFFVSRKMSKDIYKLYTTYLRYTPPCEQMDVISTVNTYKQKLSDANKQKNQLRIHFIFLTKKYEEVQSIREYGMDSLWAEVGGYIGIFLGYSLLQVVEVLLMFPTWMLEKSSSKQSSTYKENLLHK